MDVYIDTTYRISTRISQEQYQELITDGIIEVEHMMVQTGYDEQPFEAITVINEDALREFVDDNRQPDDLYLENIEIGE